MASTAYTTLNARVRRSWLGTMLLQTAHLINECVLGFCSHGRLGATDIMPRYEWFFLIPPIHLGSCARRVADTLYLTTLSRFLVGWQQRRGGHVASFTT